jgi:hypothetical protein
MPRIDTQPPTAHINDLTSADDGGRIVTAGLKCGLQARVKNDGPC